VFKTIKKHYLIALAVAVIAVWAITLIFISPEEIIEKIGTKNSYFIVFLLAVIGGLSTITGTSFFASIATFANGGADPLLLGLIGGIGIFISDSVFFFLANQGTKAITEKENSFRSKILKSVEKIPHWFIGVFVFLYVGLSPLPNDILMIALALAKIRYSKIALPILFGSITIASITTFIGVNI